MMSTGYNNLHDILQNLSSTATWFWWGLMKVRNPINNVAVMHAVNTQEARKISKAFVELHNHDLVKRIKHQHYMINPKAYLPILKHYEDVNTAWNLLK